MKALQGCKYIFVLAIHIHKQMFFGNKFSMYCIFQLTMQSFLWSLSLVWFFLTVSTPVGIADDHSDSSIDSFYCRSRGKLLEKSNFLLETCYLCYIYMPKIQFKPNAKWRPSKHKPSTGYEVPWLTNGTKEVSLSCVIHFEQIHNFICF